MIICCALLNPAQQQGILRGFSRESLLALVLHFQGRFPKNPTGGRCLGVHPFVALKESLVVTCRVFAPEGKFEVSPAIAVTMASSSIAAAPGEDGHDIVLEGYRRLLP